MMARMSLTIASKHPTSLQRLNCWYTPSQGWQVIEQHLPQLLNVLSPEYALISLGSRSVPFRAALPEFNILVITLTLKIRCHLFQGLRYANSKHLRQSRQLAHAAGDQGHSCIFPKK
jgi:hypothetical protein